MKMLNSIFIYTIATALAVYFGHLYTRTVDTIPGSGKNREIKKTETGILSFLPLFLLSALRWNTGTDTYHTYTPQYYGMIWSNTGHLSSAQKSWINDSWNHLIERPDNIRGFYNILQYYVNESSHTSFLFRLLEYPLVHFNMDVQWLYIITSAIILGLIFASIYRQSVNVSLAIFFFVATSNYFLSLNIIAQYIAIGLCLFACEYAEKRKPVKFFLLVAVAIGFHTSAFVFLPVYFLKKINIRPLWCFGLIAVCLAGSPVLFRLIETVVKISAPKYARYFSDQPEFETVYFAIGLFTLIVGSYYFEKCKNMPYFKIWYYMNVLGMMALAFSGQVPFMKRINYYFSAPLFMLLPLLINAEENEKKRNLLKWGLILLFVLETVVAVFIMNKNEVMPYTFCWQRSLGIRIAAPLV